MVSQFHEKSMGCGPKIMWGGCASISSACLLRNLVNRLWVKVVKNNAKVCINGLNVNLKLKSSYIFRIYLKLMLDKNVKDYIKV